MSQQGTQYDVNIPAGMFADSSGTPQYLGTQIYDQNGNLISGGGGNPFTLNQVLLIFGGALALFLVLGD